jgi:hypothetical protein
MKLISTHRLLVYADDVNILGERMNAVKKTNYFSLARRLV